MSLAQGFHAGIPAAQYHMDLAPQPSLSSSVVKILLNESPRKAWYSHPRLNPNYRVIADSKFDLGTAAHAVLLENDASRIVVIDPEQYPSQKGNIPDGWTNKAIRAARDNAYGAGKTPLLKSYYDDVRQMVDAALAFIEESEISDAWHDAESEVTGIWQEGGVWLRCRFDRLTKDRRVIIDYKSTTDASPDGFSRQIPRMDYHIQDAFYRRCVRALGFPDPRFVFLPQECEPPYDPSLAGCSDALRQIADAEVERAVRLWRECVSSGTWPGYPKDICYAEPTSYMIQEHELRLTMSREYA